MKINKTIIFLFSCVIIFGDAFAQTKTNQTLHLNANNNEIFLSNSSVHNPNEPQDPIDPPAVALQCFNEVDLSKLVEIGEQNVIIHHGEPKQASAYITMYSHSEVLNLYVNNHANIQSLSQKDMRGILSGVYHNWSQLGGSDLAISVYAQNQSIKADALNWQLEKHNTPIKIDIAGYGNYDFLAQKVVEVPGAIALGLRSVSDNKIIQVKTKRILPLKPSGDHAYVMPVYLYVKKGSKQANLTAKKILKYINNSAVEDNIVYPLKSKINLISK